MEGVKLGIGEAIGRDIDVGALQRCVVRGLDIDDTHLGVFHS